MHLQTAKIVSAPTRDFWSQVYLDGNFFVVMKIEKEAEPAVLGREIIKKIHQEYTSSQDGILEKLEASLKKIQDKKIAVVAGVVWENILYLAILHQGRAVLLREGNLVTILRGQDGIITTSGFLKENDCFVLGTERFFELIPSSLLKANLLNKEPEETVEALAPIVHESKEDGGLAAIIGKIGTTKTPAPETKEQKMMMTIALVLTGLLFISVVFGFIKRRHEEKTRRVEQIYQEIEYKFQEGKELIALNPLRARELFSESLDLVGKNEKYPKIKALEKEIKENLEKVLAEYQLTQVPVFLDLTLVKTGFRGIDFDLWGKEIMVLGEDGTVVKLDFKKKAEIKGKIKEGKLVTLWGEKGFVLGEKIVEIGQKREIEKDWEEVVSFEAFAGNLYLLEKKGIFKYPSIQEGFGPRRSWLGPGVEPDLRKAIGLAIDGDLWILLSSGKILKFSGGAPKAFSIAGLDKELKEPTAFYTDEDCQRLYVLDKGNKRIVVLNKSGEYHSQYLWEGIKDVDDFVVSESEKKTLLLDGEKVYEIELR